MTRLKDHFKETEELFDEQFEDRDFCGCYEGDVMGHFKNGSKKCKDFIHTREKALLEKFVGITKYLKKETCENKIRKIHGFSYVNWEYADEIEKLEDNQKIGYNQALSDIQYILKELL